MAGPLYPHLSAGLLMSHVWTTCRRQRIGFYNAQRFTLNITRTAMRQVGYAPSVRLFEAAACATPIISDAWPGPRELFQAWGRDFSVSQQKRRCSTCTTSRQKNAVRWVPELGASWQSIQPSIGRPHLRDMC